MSSAAHLPSGYILERNYRIESVLGQGGFGITYLATDLTLSRKVAIKEFFPKEFCDREQTTSHVTMGASGSRELVEQLKTKFLSEAQKVAKFDNPRITKIYAAFEANNTAYYVMEYIEGENLKQRVERDGPMRAEDAVRYIEQVGEALEYIHSRRVCHLDVKPANIMVRRDGNLPILIDFGLAKRYDSQGSQTSTTPTGVSAGFAPIEQYKDGGVSQFAPQTDVYSLAATLFYLLTGTVPPQSIDLVSEGLTFPIDFPGKLIAPIEKAMSTSIHGRHESVGAFLNEIKSKGPNKPEKPRQKTHFVLGLILASIGIITLVAPYLFFHKADVGDYLSESQMSAYEFMAYWGENDMNKSWDNIPSGWRFNDITPYSWDNHYKLQGENDDYRIFVCYDILNREVNTVTLRTLDRNYKDKYLYINTKAHYLFGDPDKLPLYPDIWFKLTLFSWIFGALLLVGGSILIVRNYQSNGGSPGKEDTARV